MTTATAQDKSSVMALIRDNQARIRTLGVVKLGLFGSFARGQQSTDSDIDLLVEFECGQETFDNFMQLYFLFEDLTGRRIEIVTPDSISPYIRPKILREVEYVPLTH
jgi:hypothetical protein